MAASRTTSIRDIRYSESQQAELNAYVRTSSLKRRLEASGWAAMLRMGMFFDSSRQAWRVVVPVPGDTRYLEIDAPDCVTVEDLVGNIGRMLEALNAQNVKLS